MPDALCYIPRQEARLALIPFPRRKKPSAEGFTDEELLSLFSSRPDDAWDVFIDRYADLILSCLARLGFDHDQAMDRFVYICEKLCEQDYRRLKGIRYAGRQGELTAWIRTVVKHLAISWAWSVDGRKRLFKSIETLEAREQRVFELFFWYGLTPSQVHERLRFEEQSDVAYTQVLDALDVIFAHLSDNQRWRLMSRLARTRTALAIGVPDPETGLVFEPADLGAGAEERLIRQERRQVLGSALDGLAPRERLILQLRYEQAMGLAEVADSVSVSLSTVKSSIRSSLAQLRRTMEEVRPEHGGDPCPSPAA